MVDRQWQQHRHPHAAAPPVVSSNTLLSAIGPTKGSSNSSYPRQQHRASVASPSGLCEAVAAVLLATNVACSNRRCSLQPATPLEATADGACRNPAAPLQHSPPQLIATGNASRSSSCHGLYQPAAGLSNLHRPSPPLLPRLAAPTTATCSTTSRRLEQPPARIVGMWVRGCCVWLESGGGATARKHHMSEEEIARERMSGGGRR
jgi:hypothetical protein